MLRCAITDFGSYRGAQGLDSPASAWSRLRPSLERWVVDGIDFVQLRERDLEAGALLALAAEAMRFLRQVPGTRRPSLLLNGRPDIAAAAGADGVHLSARPGELAPAQVRQVFHAAGRGSCRVSRSCHTLEEVAAARDDGAGLLLFGPVFGKQVRGQPVMEGTGLPLLRAACGLAAPVPVLALGGVSPANAEACQAAGAAGVAGIRWFA